MHGIFYCDFVSTLTAWDELEREEVLSTLRIPFLLSQTIKHRLFNYRECKVGRLFFEARMFFPSQNQIRFACEGRLRPIVAP
jgi:hypothetical protein